MMLWENVYILGEQPGLGAATKVLIIQKYAKQAGSGAATRVLIIQKYAKEQRIPMKKEYQKNSYTTSTFDVYRHFHSQ